MDDDNGVQLAAYHPGNTQMAFPTPDPSRVNPQPSTAPAQQLQNAVRGLFFQKPLPVKPDQR